MDERRDLEYHVGYWLRLVSNHVSGAFQRRLAAHGITVAEWVTLRSIHALGACSLSQLAERIGCDASTVSRLVERVLRKGYAARVHSDADRRSVRIELTKTGRTLAPKLGREADANDELHFGHLSKKQRQALLDLMQDLARKHQWTDKPVS
jgi:DNA-binding MarR family transcriptional regulator